MTTLKPLTLPLEVVKELLTSEEGTCLRRREGRVTLKIHPKYGVDIRRGVKEELDAMSSRYSKQLGGIPMAWEKIRTSSTGAIVDASPYIHVSVQGTFYIFSPEVNASLQGTVKKKSPSHLSCLVHRIFNVSVPRPQEVSAQEWEGSTLEEGDVIEVAVTNVDMTLYLPMITGRLKRVIARKPPDPAADVCETRARKVFTDSGISDDDGDGEDDDDRPTKKKKEVAEAKGAATPSVANGVGEPPAEAETKTKTKKRKKKEATLSEAESDALFLTSLIAEDAAARVAATSSSSKKRKAEEEEGDGGGGGGSKKSKKRRKEFYV